MANSHTTFGATLVTSPSNESTTHLQHPHADSPFLTPQPSAENLTIINTSKSHPISSPFYEHPPASYEVVNSQRHSQVTLPASAFDKDVEVGATSLLPSEDENPFTSRHSLCHNKECTMWPSKQTLMQNQKNEKRLVRDRKSFAPWCAIHNSWAGLTRRQRLWIKLGFGVLLVAILVAVGVGISLAVNGGVYSSNGASKPINT